MGIYLDTDTHVELSQGDSFKIPPYVKHAVTSQNGFEAIFVSVPGAADLPCIHSGYS